MKLFVVAIVLIAGHLVAALDPSTLYNGGHIIDKSGELEDGAYEKIDTQVGEPMQKYMTPKGIYISQELYDPLYDPLDECLKNNDAECIRHIFDEFHKLDQGLTANINDPKIKAGYAEFTENMFKAGEEAADEAQQTGKVNLKEFDKEHKDINDKFYELMD